jgi:hypothetical protein
VPRHFDTYDDLDLWVKSSTRFGGTLLALGEGDAVLYYAGRYRDSPRGALESAVYRFSGEVGGYRLVFYLPEVPGAERLVALVDSTIRISQWDAYDKDTTSMAIPIPMLPESVRAPAYGQHRSRNVDDLGVPSDQSVTITRDAAVSIARGALEADGLSVMTLHLVNNTEWGVHWRAESVVPHDPSRGPGKTWRILLIDSESGELLDEFNCTIEWMAP